jgi:23S rRNA (cytidine1920-2'-O)/16S rRNA (cytidine1409-2'-O)-methyltransferase
VVSLEGVNGRDLDSETIPEPVGLLVCDVSFVSVIKVLTAPLSLCAAEADAVILIKPQFEVGRDNIGKGGIVANENAVTQATVDVVAFMADAGWAHRLSLPSPIAGGDGNRETVAVFRRG